MILRRGSMEWTPFPSRSVAWKSILNKYIRWTVKQLLFQLAHHGSSFYIILLSREDSSAVFPKWSPPFSVWSAPVMYFFQIKELLKNTGRKTDKPEVQRLPLFHNSPSCEAHSQETQDWPEDHSVNNLWFQFLFLASCLVCLKDFTIWKASIS